MFSCRQILEAFLWFVLIPLLNVTLIILTVSVSRLLNLLLRLVAFLHFLSPQCVAGIRRCILFFSSRRRHTRSLCDWSSDVCSSDSKSPSLVAGEHGWVTMTRDGDFALGDGKPARFWGICSGVQTEFSLADTKTHLR